MFGHQDDDLNSGQVTDDNTNGYSAAPPDTNAFPVPDSTVPAATTPPAISHTFTSNPPASAVPPQPEPETEAEPVVTATTGKSEQSLMAIKQQALAQLQPLVGHLEQTAEEKFRTTMMMIQAADNQSLIPDAYAAAQEITDEKTRAQALLDVVNEINYFSSRNDNDKPLAA